MRTWMRAGALGLALAFGMGGACAARSSLAPAAKPAVAQRATIADAAWLAGRWVGEGLGGTMEETWAPPHGGQMVGHFALIQEGRPAFYELMLIDEFEGGLRLRVKHFNPDFVGWEEKDGWHTFSFVSAAPGELVFGGLALRRVSDTEALGLIRVRHGENDVREETLRYRRAPL